MKKLNDCSLSLKVEDFENYIKTIFDLQRKIHDKDWRIAVLEFELEVERSLLSEIKSRFNVGVRNA